MRGKYANRAVMNQSRARDAYIDDLQAELKAMRRRLANAEHRAALIPGLEQRIAEFERSTAEDEVFAELSERIHKFAEANEACHERIQLMWKAIIELVRQVRRFTGMGEVDVVEFVCRQWPGLLVDDDEVANGKPARYKMAASGLRLSDDAVRRLQAVQGRRVHIPDGDKDYADYVAAAFAKASQVGG